MKVKKHLIDSAIEELELSAVSFNSLSDGFAHLYHDFTPFILISEVITTKEVNLKKMYETLTLPHFKGVIFLSQYGDDILDVAKQMARNMGFDNVYGMGLPASAAQIKQKIARVIKLATHRVESNNVDLKFDVDKVDFALRNGLFEPYFQAQVCASTEEIKGFEILSRLCVDDKVYTPDTFIDTLVQYERITEFTYFILKKVFQLLKGFKQFNGMLSLNVDYQSLEDFDFAYRIIAILKQAGFPTDKFTVEITENSPTINTFVMHNLAVFRMAKCHVSIDDFGTKGSGFTELLKLPFSELKIDKDFVSDMQDSPRTCKVVKALCAVAKSLDCNIVAEGVENQKQRALLRTLGVSYIQGYLYGRAKPIPEAMRSLTANLLC